MARILLTSRLFVAATEKFDGTPAASAWSFQICFCDMDLYSCDSDLVKGPSVTKTLVSKIHDFPPLLSILTEHSAFGDYFANEALATLHAGPTTCQLDVTGVCMTFMVQLVTKRSRNVNSLTLKSLSTSPGSVTLDSISSAFLNKPSPTYFGDQDC
jgi:hypothetical protein